MFDKDFVNWGLIGVILMSVLGGLVRYAQTVKKSKSPFFTKALAIDLLGSLLIGLIVGLGCKGLGWDESIAGALGGVSGHMGSRFLKHLSEAIEHKVKKLIK